MRSDYPVTTIKYTSIISRVKAQIKRYMKKKIHKIDQEKKINGIIAVQTILIESGRNYYHYSNLSTNIF